jgi:deferrochelatase/peroxidase EfeB
LKSLQEGIYYTKGSRPGQSIGIIFLRTNKSSNAPDVGKVVGRIWNACSNLKKGVTRDFRDLNLTYPKLYHDLTIMIGYGPKIFNLEGALRKKPEIFSDFLFIEPNRGGGPVVRGTDLSYHEDIIENHAALDDIVIQFISNNAFITNQCIVEIWREISEIKRIHELSISVSITKFYDGFRRADNRNWMGFHDGVSNIKDEERKDIIAINASQVKQEDNWTIGGTFMGFVRLYIDLQNWWSVNRNEQELMVGRDKVTGCPIIGMNETTGKNIVMKGCPKPGTKEVTDNGNEIFRNHPQYGFQMLPTGASDELLKFSHIAEARKITTGSLRQKEQYRIFRQGYEFLEKIESYPGIRAGLNFISFQDNPIRLLNTIVNINTERAKDLKTGWNGRKKDDLPKYKFNSFFRVGAAGIFFVPPQNSEEQFPGASIFFTRDKMKEGSGVWKP